jgi:prophage antirepressor-like protein
MNNNTTIIKTPTTYYNLRYVATNIIKSKNPKEYVKNIKSKQFINGIHRISREDLIIVLEKCKNENVKEYLENIKQNKEVEGLVNTQEVKKETNNNYVDIGKSIFHFDGYCVDYINDNDKYYFKAKEICDILEYVNTNKAILTHVKNKNKYKLQDLIKNPNITTNTPKGVPKWNPLEGVYNTDPLEGCTNIQLDTIYIDEVGLYTLIMKSNKPEATKFMDWITEDILPSLRKTGEYKMKTFDFAKYENKNCLYIFNVDKTIYKFGRTRNLEERFGSHKTAKMLYNPEIQVKHIEVFERHDDLIEIEDILKEYVKGLNIQTKYNGGVEFFNGDKNTIKDIKQLIESFKDTKQLIYIDKHHTDKMEHSLKLLVLQNEQLEKQYKLKELDEKSTNSQNELNNDINNDINYQLKLKEHDICIANLQIVLNESTNKYKLKEYELIIEHDKIQIDFQLKNKQMDIEIEKLKINKKEPQIVENKDIEMEKVNKSNSEIEIVKEEESLNKEETQTVEDSNKYIKILKKCKKSKKEETPKVIKSTLHKACIQCNIKISRKATYCMPCVYYNRFCSNTKKPSMEQINKDIIELKSLTKIGKKYSVTDNSVKKWIATYKKYEHKTKV